MSSDNSLSRRTLLQHAAAAGTAEAVAGATPALAKKPPPRRARKRSVVVLGGRMAGLTAAHELAERGFDVTVYARNALGGKARSIPVAHTAKGGRRDLHGEHGFRFFPGFYHHVPDTMRRIPFPGNANGVWDNMVAANGAKWLRAGDRPDGGPFAIAPDSQQALTVDGLPRILMEVVGQRDVPPQEM